MFKVTLDVKAQDVIKFENLPLKYDIMVIHNYSHNIESLQKGEHTQPKVCHNFMQRNKKMIYVYKNPCIKWSFTITKHGSIIFDLTNILLIHSLGDKII